MGDNQVTTIFSPESGQWILTNGQQYVEMPWWAHEYLRDNFESETKWLRDTNARLKDTNDKLRELISLLLVVRKYTISCNPLDCKSCRVEKECREGTRLAKDLGFDYKEIKIPDYPDYKSPDYL